MTITMSPEAESAAACPDWGDPLAGEPVGVVITAEEYDALPENPRRELVDGLVHLMAAPTFRHQLVKDNLRQALRGGKPDDFVVLTEVEVRLGELKRRVPDVVVISKAAFAARRRQSLPGDLLLVVEVVSPGSESTDRMFKLAEYARAGIRHFWRVETESGVRVHTFRLADDGAYLPTGVFTAGDVIDAPGLRWAKVAVDDLAAED